jgi:hypothetical protein
MKNLAGQKSKLRRYVALLNGLGFGYFDKSGNPVSDISKVSNSKHKFPFWLNPWHPLSIYRQNDI